MAFKNLFPFWQMINKYLPDLIRKLEVTARFIFTRYQRLPNLSPVVLLFDGIAAVKLTDEVNLELFSPYRKNGISGFYVLCFSTRVNQSPGSIGDFWHLASPAHGNPGLWLSKSWYSSPYLWEKSLTLKYYRLSFIQGEVSSCIHFSFLRLSHMRTIRSAPLNFSFCNVWSL